MSARNSMHRCSSVLPFLAPPTVARAPPSASTRRDVFPLSSLYDRALTPFSDFLSESDTGPEMPLTSAERQKKYREKIMYNITPNIPDDDLNRIKRKILELNVLSQSLEHEYQAAHDNKTKSILKNLTTNEVAEKYKCKEKFSKVLGLKSKIRKCLTLLLGTPDFRSEESDSSAGSALQLATAAASRALAAEWERIERTLYEEPGEHVRRRQLLDECRQWRELVPHLRVVGKKIPLPERRQLYHDTAEEEVIAAHYSDCNDCNDCSESEERLSESSFSDTTPSNSPRAARQSLIPTAEPRLNREKSAYARTNYNDTVLNDSFYSMLQITPLYPRSPPLGGSTGKRHYSSILKSEISSSKWTRNYTPDSPRTKGDRNSAKSFVSLNTRNCTALSANERKKLYNGTRIYTAKQRDVARLQPLYNSYTVSGDGGRQTSSTNHQFMNGKLSLPPLHIDEETSKVKSLNSARRNTVKRSRRSAASRAITLISETKNF